MRNIKLRNFNHNLNVVFRFGNFKILGHRSPKVYQNFEKVAKIHAGYHIKQNFNQNLNAVSKYQNFRIAGSTKGIQMFKIIVKLSAGYQTNGNYNPTSGVVFRWKIL